MKKSIIILILLIGSFSIFAQDLELDAKYIRSTITSPDGGFFILNTDDDYPIKFWLRADGQVNWYLDGQDMFIRDGNFEAFPGVFTSYDFLHIDGGTGRIGFNILSDPSYNELPLTSSIHLNGSIATRVRILNGDNAYAIKQDDHIMIIDQQANDNTAMILPAVATSKGREYIFKRNGNGEGTIIVKPQSGEELDGDGDTDGITLDKDNASLEVVCDGSGWWALSEKDVRAAVQPVTTTTGTLGDHSLIEVKFPLDDPIVLTLPAAADYADHEYEIKRNDVGSSGYTSDVLSIKPASEDTLDQYTNASPYLMPNDWESVTIRSNGVNWLIISNYGHL